MYEYNLGLRFQRIARERPDETALWFGEKEEAFSFGALNARANRAARWLLDRGVEAADVVCLSGVKSPQTFALMIGCLKIGAIYSILDPDTPPERLRRILSTCLPKLLLAEPDFLRAHEAVAAEQKVAAFEKADAADLDGADLAETRLVTGEQAAYIMFTSGSTGVPKGAVMTHANVLNLIEWARETYAIVPEDRLTNVNPLYFDNSVFDFYASLFNGARLVPFSRAETRDPRALVDKVDGGGCTLWFSVPSLLIFLQTMKATDGVRLRSVRRFVFGGEGYPKAKLQKLYEAYAPASAFFNVYGPTECTCICSSYEIGAADFEDIQGLPPLGDIAPNFSCLILGEDGRAVVPGEKGELCLLGPNVGKGYYNDPERTASSFVQNPLNPCYREIMYRTGDLVSLSPADGKLHIQGRRDNQIKHMGYRIELEEIESALHRLDYVAEAAALHTDAGGHSRIVAIVAMEQPLAADAIRNDLKRLIPDYMIPSVFHRENVLPKNANGKVDRRRLAETYLGGGS
jgi:D-alanine--poly(phosphoribitol) ligase subunit 1